jgi:hypothetical protein
MPMKTAVDHGGGLVENNYCRYCTDERGRLKSRVEVRNGMTNFYMNLGKSRRDAEAAVEEAMAKMPAWKR